MREYLKEKKILGLEGGSFCKSEVQTSLEKVQLQSRC